MAPKIKRVFKRLVAGTKKLANKVALKGKQIGGKIVDGYNRANTIGARIVANLPDVARKINNTGETISSTVDTIGRKLNNTAKFVEQQAPIWQRKAQKTAAIADRKYQKTLVKANKWYQKGQKAMETTKGFVDRVKNANLPGIGKKAFRAITKLPLEQQTATPKDENPPVDLPAAVPRSTSGYTLLNSNPGDFAAEDDS